MTKDETVSQIKKLKIEKQAVILAHNYQRPEIQEIADFLGDSLDLAKKSVALKEKLIIFCGVHFMAETSKILAPEKTVLLPELEAGCPLAECATVDAVLQSRKEHPNAVFIAYINTSAAVKALCDCIVTSANALKILRHYRNHEIVYLPDRNLAAYAENILAKSIIKWTGQCYVHHFKILLEDLKNLQKLHPEALLMVHPETSFEIVDIADIVTGTSGMISEAGSRSEQEFIVGTEIGMVHRLRKLYPNKIFHEVPDAICSQMKLTTLNSALNALKTHTHEIHVPAEIASKAHIALRKMMELS